MTMNMQTSAQTVAVLANANELASFTILSLVGGELAASVQNSPLSREMLYALVQAKIQARYAAILEN